MGKTARLGLKVGNPHVFPAFSNVEKGKTARLGLKESCRCRVFAASHGRNGEDSPVGIERYRDWHRGRCRHCVEKGKTARLGLKAALDHARELPWRSRNGEDSPVGIESRVMLRTLSASRSVEMGKTARLGLKELKKHPYTPLDTTSKWGRQPGWD